MQSAQEYLDATETAAKHLFAGIDSYIEILRSAPLAVFSGNFVDEESHRAALDSWCEENQEKLRQRRDAERKFIAEQHAMATLCGSLIQLASMAVHVYSQNTKVFCSYATVIKPGSKPAKYCIGREIRGVPLGLVIYATRNQHNHLEDDSLREPNRSVFEDLASNHGYGVGVRDPAFDLNSKSVWSYASNVSGLIGWRNYDLYREDMDRLLEI